MKVRMLVSMAGASESFAPGDEREVSDEIGRAWIEAGIAEPVKKEVKRKAASK